MAIPLDLRAALNATLINATLTNDTASLATPVSSGLINGAPTPAQAKKNKVASVVVCVCIIIFAISVIVYMWLAHRKAKRAELELEKNNLSVFQTPAASFFPGMFPTIRRSPMASITYLDPQGQVVTVSDQSQFGGLSPNTAGAAQGVSTPLPPPTYSEKPRFGEDIMGRAGERESDTIKSPPETRAEADAKYEEEMQALYNIRCKRREELQAKQKRQALREKAAATNDVEALRALRDESLEAARRCETDGSLSLINQYESRPKIRKYASVHYQDLGVVRHDGSCVQGQPDENASGADTRQSIYDFPGVKWEAESDVGSIHSNSFVGPSRSSSLNSTATSSKSTSTNACSDHLSPSLTPGGLPTYSALERTDEAPPYSSPLTRPASGRASMLSTQAIKSPVNSVMTSVSEVPHSAGTLGSPNKIVNLVDHTITENPHFAIASASPNSTVKLIGDSTIDASGPATSTEPPTCVVHLAGYTEVPRATSSSPAGSSPGSTPTIIIQESTPIEPSSEARVHLWADPMRSKPTEEVYSPLPLGECHAK